MPQILLLAVCFDHVEAWRQLTGSNQNRGDGCWYSCHEEMILRQSLPASVLLPTPEKIAIYLVKNAQYSFHIKINPHVVRTQHTKCAWVLKIRLWRTRNTGDQGQPPLWWGVCMNRLMSLWAIMFWISPLLRAGFCGTFRRPWWQWGCQTESCLGGRRILPFPFFWHLWEISLASLWWVQTRNTGWFSKTQFLAITTKYVDVQFAFWLVHYLAFCLFPLEFQVALTTGLPFPVSFCGLGLWGHYLGVWPGLIGSGVRHLIDANCRHC